MSIACLLLWKILFNDHLDQTARTLFVNTNLVNILFLIIFVEVNEGGNINDVHGVIIG